VQDERSHYNDGQDTEWRRETIHREPPVHY